MNELTEKQENILQHIKAFIKVHKYSPTIRELCLKTKLKSPATIYQHLVSLKNKGYIDFEKGKSRTIKVIKGE